MSDDHFQFFVMIGGPFWCALLLCFLGDWVYRAFTRWRWRNWWRTHQTPVEKKTWIFKDNRIVFHSPTKNHDEDYEKGTEEDAEGKQLF